MHTDAGIVVVERWPSRAFPRFVDEQMHREAAPKLDAWASDQQAKAKAERKGQVRRFKNRRAS